MSPVGLDSKAYVYSVRFVNVAAPGPPQIVNVVGWLVTRIVLQARTAGADLQIAGQLISVPAGGCVELLPGGAHRTGIGFSGDDYVAVIEFWFPAQSSGVNP